VPPVHDVAPLLHAPGEPFRVVPREPLPVRGERHVIQRGVVGHEIDQDPEPVAMRLRHEAAEVGLRPSSGRPRRRPHRVGEPASPSARRAHGMDGEEPQRGDPQLPDRGEPGRIAARVPSGEKARGYTE